MQSTAQTRWECARRCRLFNIFYRPEGIVPDLKPVSLWSDGKMLKAAMVAEGPDESPVRSAGLSNVLVRRALAKHPTASRAQILVPWLTGRGRCRIGFATSLPQSTDRSCMISGRTFLIDSRASLPGYVTSSQKFAQSIFPFPETMHTATI
jgi:hypothetical protein